MRGLLAGLVAGLCAIACTDGATQEENYKKAIELYQRGNTGEALAEFRKVYDADDAYTNAGLMAAKILYYNKDYAGAEAQLRRMTDDSLAAQVWLARALAAQDQNDEALKLAELALQSDAGNIDAWMVKGELHEKSGDTAGAMAAYGAALAEGRKLAMVHLRLADLYARADLKDAAREQFRRAVDLSDGDPTIRSAAQAFELRAAGE